MQSVASAACLQSTCFLHGKARCRQDSRSPLDITALPLDLASFRSIRGFAETLSGRVGDAQIDMLVLNAAVMQTPQWRTREGFEYQTGVNYLGHVELTKLLLEGLMLRKVCPCPCSGFSPR